MRVLFLDDDHERHRLAQNFIVATVQGLPAGWSLHRSYTAAEAVRAMDDVMFDVVFLDHDLSVDEQMCDPNLLTHTNSGTYVVRRMVERAAATPDVSRPTVIVHSYNGGAAANMVADLKAAGFVVHYVPFRYIHFPIERSTVVG